ncbi:DUF5908 family protein [Puia sp. P3]|uniref:DUF5908 family protein n=1 Tax=Puia sp. P3 TaxID=3423952 RepID=UPI003D66FC4A
MPVEIRELVIRATVTEDGKSGSPAPAAGSGDVQSPEQIVKLCVDRILEILKEKNGR